MATDLNELDSAARLREVIAKIAADVLEETNPRPRYATVTAVNTTTRKITLQYPDEAGTFILSGTEILPVVGAVVRVSGRSGARYVDEIVTATGVTVTGTLAVLGNTNITGTAVITSTLLSGIHSLNTTGYVNDAVQVNNWVRPFDGTNFHLKAATGGMYLDCDNHFLRTAAGTQRVAVSSTGIVMANNLEISGTGSAALKIGSTWPSSSSYACFTVTGMGGTGYALLCDTNSTFISSGTAGTYLRGPSNSASDQIAVTPGAITTTSGSLSINVAGGQRMSIDTSGNVFVAMGASNGGNICTPNAFGQMLMIASREVLKERIVTIPTSASVDRIKAMRPVEFYFKEAAVSGGNQFTPLDLQRGFIAEEVAAVDHTMSTWGWVNPDNEYEVLTTQLIDEDPDLADCVPVMWNVFAVVADLVASLQNALARIEVLEAA